MTTKYDKLAKLANQCVGFNRAGEPDYFIGTFNVTAFAELIAGLEAQEGELCTYPDCKCPFDAPADKNWCAIALQQPSEPVAKFIHTKGTGLLEGTTITKVMLDINHVDLPEGTQLYTTPQPDRVAELEAKLKVAVEALEYWRNECSGNEPSISVFQVKVDEALAKIEE